MNKLFKLSMHENATLVYFLNNIIFGLIHQKDMNKVKGIVIGIWRFQLQISIGYSQEKETIGEMGHA
jgi:hypothetical protein